MDIGLALILSHSLMLDGDVCDGDNMVLCPDTDAMGTTTGLIN